MGIAGGLFQSHPHYYFIFWFELSNFLNQITLLKTICLILQTHTCMFIICMDLVAFT